MARAPKHVEDILSDSALQLIRQRVRVLQLLDAVEHAGIAPIPARRLHAFAYLADVLSPVWNLLPFDGKILKIKGGPHYSDLQTELDRLVVLGLVEVSNLHFLDRPGGGARIDGKYALRFESPFLTPILSALNGTSHSDSLDPQDRQVAAFLVDLASALATVPDDQIDGAATVDATYADERIGVSNIVDFASWASDEAASNLSVSG